MLDEALENNAMPSIEINTSHFAPREIVYGGHANHALAVVGRRPGADGKCEYLIRNSWGKGCSFYLPQIAEKCDPAKGSFWLTSSQLDGNVDRIVHLKSSNNKKNSNVASNGEGPVLPEDRSVEQNNKNEIVKEANPIPVNPGPIDNGRYKNPFAGLGFGDLMNTVMKGIETAVSGIWHSISNMFKY
jgi:hypothetical protein